MTDKPKKPSKPRPYVYSDELADEIINRFASGETLYSIAMRDDMPSLTTIYKWQKEFIDFGSAISNAREINTEATVDQMIYIADNEFDAARARNRIAARQWLVEKRNPAKYGARLDVNVNQQISISSALADAKARVLRPICDLENVIEGESHVVTSPDKLIPTDQGSVDPDPLNILY